MTKKSIYTVTQKEIDALKKANIIATTKRGISKAFHQTGRQLIATGKQLILSKDKTGRIYHYVVYGGSSKIGPKKITKKTHQASAPGEAPANLSGTLKSSFNYTIQGAKSITFGNSAKYAADLEFGTARVKARPYMSKSIETNQRDIENIFQDTITVEITKGII